MDLDSNWSHAHSSPRSSTRAPSDDNSDGEDPHSFLLERQISLLTLKLAQSENEVTGMTDEVQALRDQNEELSTKLSAALTKIEELEKAAASPQCSHEPEMQLQAIQIENMNRYIAELREELAKRDSAMQQLSAVVRQQQRTIRAMRAADKQLMPTALGGGVIPEAGA